MTRKTIFKTRLCQILELQRDLNNFGQGCEKSMNSYKLKDNYNQVCKLKNDTVYTMFPTLIDSLCEQYLILMIVGNH